MIFFVVAVGTRNEVERVAPALMSALAATRLVDGTRTERIAPDGTWALAAIEEPDPCRTARLAFDSEAFVVFNGPAMATHGDQRRLADDLLRGFRELGSSGVVDRLNGTYNFVGVSARSGLRAFSDFSGMYPIYWHAGNGVALFSNRSLVVSDVVGDRDWDAHALGWVIARANLAGESLPLRGVHLVPPGVEAHAALDTGTVKLERNSGWIWPSPSDDRVRDNLSSEEWDDITDDLVASMRALEAFDPPLRLSLTGGKDSRLCLSLAMAAGLGDAMEVYTNGGPDSPEVEAAAAVAHAAGVPHHLRGAAVRPKNGDAGTPRAQPDASPWFDGKKVWERLRRNITRYEALVPPWAALQNPTQPPFMNIKGFGGEFYRHGSDKRFRNTDVHDAGELAARFVAGHRAMDRLGIIRDAEAARQAQWLTEWVHETAAEVRLDAVHEKFHVDTALSHWSGPLLQGAPQRVNINPLASAGAATKNLELSASARRAERFHFEVMRRAAPEIVCVPFLNDVWSPELADGLSISLPQEPFPTTVKPVGRAIHQGNPGWQFVDSERRAIDRLFKEAAKHTDMDAVCDMKKLRRCARSSKPLTLFGEIREMVGAIGMALTLLDRAEPAIS